jgi:hypothetical protein
MVMRSSVYEMKSLNLYVLGVAHATRSTSTDPERLGQISISLEEVVKGWRGLIEHYHLEINRLRSLGGDS